jgi:hypothetical protein
MCKNERGSFVTGGSGESDSGLRTLVVVEC